MCVVNLIQSNVHLNRVTSSNLAKGNVNLSLEMSK